MPEQTHFSLMGELLDPDIPPDEQVAALLNHADKEFSLTDRQIQSGFDLAAGNLDRAHLWNDFGTALLSAVGRIVTRWAMEDTGQEPPPGDAADYEILKRFLVSELGVNR